MTAYTWDDPGLIDLTASAGSAVIGTSAPVAGYAIAGYSADLSATYFPATAIIDGNVSTCWETAGAPGADTWIAIRDISGPVTLNHYQLRERNGWGSRAPLDWTIEGSSDSGATWTVVDTQTGFTGWNNTFQTFNLDNPATYEWFRIKVTATQYGDIVNLAEFYLNDLVVAPSSGGATTLYYELQGNPKDRHYTLTVANGTGVFNANWGGLNVYSADYPATNYDIGYFNPYANSADFYSAGTRLILSIQLTSPGDVTLSWTSEDYEDRPYSWLDPVTVTLPNDTITYDAIHGDTNHPGRERHYLIVPTSTDLISVTSNEPNTYFEVYRETGNYTYDEYVEDGYNLADGTPDPNGGSLVFTPEVGQTYHLVVYPNGDPDLTTTYQVTVAAAAAPPPPYVVANDLYANFIDLGAIHDGYVHGYDNTGASTDPEYNSLKRSIWYRFIVDADSMIRLKLTPGDPAPESRPYVQVQKADGTYVGSGQGAQVNYAMYARLVPGVEYRMAIFFDESSPLSSWDSNGSMAFEVVPTPPAYVAYLDPTSTPYTLQPGSDAVGGGQNYYVGRVFPDSTVGALGVVQIVAPHDGGLSIIIEAGNDGGTTYRPSVEVEVLKYQIYDYWTSRTRPLYLSTDHVDPLNHPYVDWMPWRAVGVTTPDPVTINVAQGDIIRVKVNTAISGVHIRWGMTTQTKPYSDWFSMRYGDAQTNDGKVVPYGLTQAQADEMRAKAVVWPVQEYALGEPVDDQSTNFDDQQIVADPQMHKQGARYDSWSYDSEIDERSGVDNAIVWEPLEVNFPSATLGLAGTDNAASASTRSVDTWPNQSNVHNGLSLALLWDPAPRTTIINLHTNLLVTRQKAYVRHDNRVSSRVNGSNDVWTPLEASAAASNKLLMDYRPFLTRAPDLLGGADPSWLRLGQSEQVLRLVTRQLQWGNGDGTIVADLPEVYNVYRWTDSISLQRSARGVYDPLNGWPGYPFNTIEMNPDYPASSPWPERERELTVNLYNIDVSLTDTAWLLPGTADHGELLESWNFPGEPGIVEKTTDNPNGYPNLSTVGPSKSRDYGGVPWGWGGSFGFSAIPLEDTIYKRDIFNGAPPAMGAKAFDFVSVLMLSCYQQSDFPWAPSLDAYWNLRGYVNGAGHDQFTNGSLFMGYEVNASVRSNVGRAFPDQIRVAEWVPSLAPLAPPAPTPLPTWGDVGGSTLTSEIGEYIYEGDVGVGVTAPILWFLYKKWGFLGDSVVAYGQGLGNTEGQLHGVLWLGPGVEYPLLADVKPVVRDWRLNAASNHAYDGTGVIFPGTSIAPPRVDAEVQTVEFIVPGNLDLTQFGEFHVYVTNDNGRSNALPLMLYPQIDVDMQATDPLLVTTASAMGSFDPTTTVVGATLSSDDKLPQRYSLLPTPFALTGHIPERAPQLLTNTAGAFTFTGAIQTTGLDDPVAITVPLTQRYRPIDSQVVPRSDIGTGVSLWMPNGTNANAWKLYVDSSPFVDPTTTIASRNGEITRPAMVFPGDAYAELVNGLHIGPNFSIAMVTTIYPDPQPRSFLLSSFIQGLPDPDTYPLEVFIEGDVVTVQVGGRLFSARIASGYIGRRPVILLLSISQWYVRFGLVSASAYVRDGSHKLQKTSGLKLYLGRSNDAGTLQIATMDVLDLAINNTALSVSDFTLTLNRFDSAYGVMK